MTDPKKDNQDDDKKIVIEEYSETGFWTKVKDYAAAAGRNVIEKALWLYFAAQKPETPAWAKGVAYSALAYFISPFDAIPDFTPFVGYSDDLGALAAAIAVLAIYIDEEVKALALEKLVQWFGEGVRT